PHYLAWFCPEEPTFFDGRPSAFADDVVVDFAKIRRALASDAESDTDWRAILRARRITHVIVHEPRERPLRLALHRLFTAPAEWSLIFCKGRALVFAWHDPASSAPRSVVKAPAVDLWARAYRPAPDAQGPRAGPDTDGQ